jgi:hypothetical protein
MPASLSQRYHPDADACGDQDTPETRKLAVRRCAVAAWTKAMPVTDMTEATASVVMS